MIAVTHKEEVYNTLYLCVVYFAVLAFRGQVGKVGLSQDTLPSLLPIPGPFLAKYYYR